MANDKSKQNLTQVAVNLLFILYMANRGGISNKLKYTKSVGDAIEIRYNISDISTY
jgi:hypothetical protein